MLDIAIGLGLAWSAFQGWRIGAVRSLIGLAGLVLAYTAAFLYGQSVGAAFFKDSALGGVTGIVLVFAAFLIVFHVLGRLARAFLHATTLGVVDAIGGGALGLVKSVLVLGLLLILARSYPLHAGIPQAIDASRLAGPVQSASLILIDGIRALWPDVKRFLDDAGIRLPGERSPVVRTLTDGADEARRTIQALAGEARTRLDGAP